MSDSELDPLFDELEAVRNELKERQAIRPVSQADLDRRIERTGELLARQEALLERQRVLRGDYRVDAAAGTGPDGSVEPSGSEEGSVATSGGAESSEARSRFWTWVLELWISQGQPDTRRFFRLLKNRKYWEAADSHSPIVQCYDDGLQWRLWNGEVKDMTISNFQKRMSEARQKFLSSSLKH